MRADEQTALREQKKHLIAQQLLRHENVATTQAYLHPSRDDLREGLRLLDRAWQGVRSEET